MKDYYQVLGVLKTATPREVKITYRKLSLQYHPDRNRGEAYFEAKFKEINEAYQILGDTEERKLYDQRFAFWKERSQTENSSDQKGYRATSATTQEYTRTADSHSKADRSKKEEFPMSNVIGIFIIVGILLMAVWLKPSSETSTVEPVIDSDLVSRLEEYSKRRANGESDSVLLKEIFKTVSDSNKIEPLLIYANDTCVIIGVLRHKLFYGSPGFGENAAVDKKEYSFILELDHPISLIDTSSGRHDPTIVDKVHVMGDDYKDQLWQFIDKKIGLTCTLVPSQTAHHHAPAITRNLVEASEVKY